MLTSAPRTLSRVLWLAFALSAPASAQLGAPVAPPENPLTLSKIRLGKTLFWDEQLSSTGTVACGTCHQPAAGFADPRSLDLPLEARYPGVDRLLGTADDAFGSPSLPRLAPDGTYVFIGEFGVGVQVTSRNAPTVLNAAYLPALFLDGRATETFLDPATGAVVSPSGAALESQSLQPLLSHKEMSVLGRTTFEVSGKMRWMFPLADAEALPADLDQWIGGRRYPALFEEAFGDTSITGVRMAQALASYMRVLVTPDLPYDRFLAGDLTALTPIEARGLDLFRGKAACTSCHPGPLLTDNAFHNIGVDDLPDDTGRLQVTHDPADRGKFRTPVLRNVETTGPYFHDGTARTLADVVDFYDRGGDFAPPNLAQGMVPLHLTAGEKAALVAFLGRPLTDPRVQAGIPPFDRPRLYSESSRFPLVFGDATAGSGGFEPRIVVLEPPRRNRIVTVGLDRALGGAPAALLSSASWIPGGQPFQGTRLYLPFGPGTRLDRAALSGSGPGLGYASLRYDLGNVPAAAIGTRIYMQWLVYDPSAGARLSASQPALVTLY